MRLYVKDKNLGDVFLQMNYVHIDWSHIAVFRMPSNSSGELFSVALMWDRSEEETMGNRNEYWPSSIGLAARKEHRSYRREVPNTIQYSDFHPSSKVDKGQILDAVETTLRAMHERGVGREEGSSCLGIQVPVTHGNEPFCVLWGELARMSGNVGKRILVYPGELTKMIAENCETGEGWARRVADTVIGPRLDSVITDEDNLPIPDWAWKDLFISKADGTYYIGDRPSVEGGTELLGVVYADRRWIRRHRDDGMRESDIISMFDEKCEYAADLLGNGKTSKCRTIFHYFKDGGIDTEFAGYPRFVYRDTDKRFKQMFPERAERVDFKIVECPGMEYVANAVDPEDAVNSDKVRRMLDSWAHNERSVKREPAYYVCASEAESQAEGPVAAVASAAVEVPQDVVDSGEEVVEIHESFVAASDEQGRM